MQQLFVLDVVEVDRNGDGGRGGDSCGRGGDGRQPPVMKLHGVVADLQDHRAVGLFGTRDDRLGVLQCDDVERRKSRAGAVCGGDEVGGAGERHQLSFCGPLTRLQQNATISIRIQSDKPRRPRSDMDATLFVGLDVGTTTSKAVVLTQDGNSVASGRATTPWTVTATGAELDATALLEAATSAVAEALADCPPGPIGGLGVASLAESGVLLDRHGRPVAPVIAWHDTRDHAELTSLRDAIGAQQFSATTGLPLRQQWSLTKHRWLSDNVPSARDAVRRLNVAEWIVRGLGGDEATEQSLASRTGWLRLADRTWWADTLDWSGAHQSFMPS